MITPDLTAALDLATGKIAGTEVLHRRLSDLRGCFADEAAYQEQLRQGNPVVYTVSSVTPGDGDGDLHYGLGLIMPGRVGQEYFLTKGHLHEWREAAELYIGLGGEGAMLLEDEFSGETQFLPLLANSTIYVPSNTAHRTINTGSSPLVYLGVYCAKAGHDYAFISERNFNKVLVAQENGPKLIDRGAYLTSLSRS